MITQYHDCVIDFPSTHIQIIIFFYLYAYNSGEIRLYYNFRVAAAELQTCVNTVSICDCEASDLSLMDVYADSMCAETEGKPFFRYIF